MLALFSNVLWLIKIPLIHLYSSVYFCENLPTWSSKTFSGIWLQSFLAIYFCDTDVGTKGTSVNWNAVWWISVEAHGVRSQSRAIPPTIRKNVKCLINCPPYKMFFGQFWKEAVRARHFLTYFLVHPGETVCDIHWFHSNWI